MGSRQEAFNSTKRALPVQILQQPRWDDVKSTAGQQSLVIQLAETVKCSTERLHPSAKMNDTISGDATPYWTVHCTRGGALCDDDQALVILVTGSHDVVLRFEDSDNAGSGDVARVSVKDSSSHSVVAQLIRIDDFPVLQLAATEDTVDVVLLRKGRVQRVVNQGSGVVTVQENVLVSNGPSLTLGVVGSGDIYVTSSTPVTVEELALSSQGSGRLQVSLSEFEVKTASMMVLSSGDVTVLAGSKGATSTLALTVEGSGSVCVSAGSSLNTNRLSVDKIGSGDVSLGPRGSCQHAELSMGGPGTIDAGGIQCHNVDVDLLGSGNVVVQATASLSGDVYGSGHLKYYGQAPHSIDNINYMGLVVAAPVSSSYQPSGCKLRPAPLPKPTDSAGSATSSPHPARVMNVGVGEDFNYDVTIDQSNILYLAGIVFFVALVLRWFNESRRRAREEQRQPLVGAARRVYV